MQGLQEFGVRVKDSEEDYLKDSRKIIDIDSYTDSRDELGDYILSWEKSKLEEYFKDEIPARLEDLINFSLAVYYADKAVRRDPKLEVKRTEKRFYSRKIHLKVPVTEVERWKEVKTNIKELLEFMTYDSFELEFYEINGQGNNFEVEETKKDIVSMFSGGQDSLAGKYYVENEGYNPEYLHIGHVNVGPIISNFEDFFQDFSPTKINIKEEGIRGGEPTQFSRSIMYMALGVGLALANDVEKVLIPENGIIARQEGFDYGRYTTRTVHPSVLEDFNEIVSSILDRDIEIENPFDLMTKGEVVSLIEDERALEMSFSCAHNRFHLGYSDSEKKFPNHCGMGMPDILRTIAVVSSSFSNPDSLLHLEKNPFKINFQDISLENNTNFDEYQKNKAAYLEARYRDSVVNLMDLMKLSKEVRKLETNQLLTKYPPLSDTEVLKMYQRFAGEIEKTVEYYSNINESIEDAWESIRVK